MTNEDNTTMNKLKTESEKSELNGLMSYPGKIVVVTDKVAQRLDEMADMAEHWKRHRDKGRIPNGIRGGMILLAQEISTLEILQTYKDDKS